MVGDWTIRTRLIQKEVSDWTIRTRPNWEVVSDWTIRTMGFTNEAAVNEDQTT